MDLSISLNKFISDTGYCSRREADKLIESGRVLLNGRPARLGNRYEEGDEVEVDGSLITAPKKDKLVYIALNKPAGITTTTEMHIPGNIISYVNHPKRIFPIGRLDKDSEGLIFLTNDGNIVNKILRAGNKHEKEYIVKLNKPAEQGFVARMSTGVPILDTVTAPCKVVMSGRQTFSITLVQGLNRQIRRMCEALGYSVVSLKRVRIMNIQLGTLATGKWRNLSDAEVAMLKASVSGSDNTAKASPKVKAAPSERPRRESPAAKPEKALKQSAKPAKKADGNNTPPPSSPKKSSYKDYRSKGKRK
ncbi:23S rRNA pseudouridine(2604) synthase RluF [Rurimicrobium arvi]|uniref:Pseudouridine synthase n=1 Tax=Rurimicrobium arvi TaxID=2049916 RepID=A0ABP8MSB2_9BACT